MEQVLALLGLMTFASLSGALLVPVIWVAVLLARRGNRIARVGLLLGGWWIVPLALVSAFARGGRFAPAPGWVVEVVGWCPVVFVAASALLLAAGRGQRWRIAGFVAANVPLAASSLLTASMAATDSWL